MTIKDIKEHYEVSPILIDEKSNRKVLYWKNCQRTDVYRRNYTFVGTIIKDGTKFYYEDNSADIKNRKENREFKTLDELDMFVNEYIDESVRIGFQPTSMDINMREEYRVLEAIENFLRKHFEKYRKTEHFDDYYDFGFAKLTTITKKEVCCVTITMEDGRMIFLEYKNGINDIMDAYHAIVSFIESNIFSLMADYMRINTELSDMVERFNPKSVEGVKAYDFKDIFNYTTEDYKDILIKKLENTLAKLKG